MDKVRRAGIVTLMVLTFFLALTAVLGAAGLLAGFNRPSLDLLQGTIFGDYTVPGLALGIIVGGGALVSAILLLRGRRPARTIAGLSGLAIIVFEFVEVLAIGSPDGAAFVLQVFYFVLGLLIVGICLGLQALEAPTGR